MSIVSATVAAPAAAPTAAPAGEFPLKALQERLRQELTAVAEESDVLHGEWDPVLDSLRIVSTLLEVEDLFPGIPLPPERLIRPGGYHSIDDAVADMTGRFQNVWNHHIATRTQ